MNLQTRLKRLEGRFKLPNKPVYVVFQKIGESGQEIENYTNAEKHDKRAMFILVKFVDPLTCNNSREP